MKTLFFLLCLRSHPGQSAQSRALGSPLFPTLSSLLSNNCSHQYGWEFRRPLYQSVTNIFEYLNIRTFLIRIFIRIFVCITFWIQIYSDIRSCQLFEYEYIRIFVRINYQIPTMLLFNFYGYYTLLMDILLMTMIKNAI